MRLSSEAGPPALGPTCSAWETRLAVDYAMVEIFKCVVMVFVIAHWTACIWCLQAYIGAPTPLGDLDSPDPIGTWLSAKGYC